MSSIPNLELRGELSTWDSLFRKLAHLFEYAILFLLWYRALYSNRSNVLIRVNGVKVALWGAFVISFIYGISDEVHQFFVPTRSAKLIDVLIDGLGVSLAGLVVLFKEKRLAD